MTVLWVCNLIIPEIAKSLGLSFIPKEGWVEGLLDELVSGEENRKERIIPQIAFPLDMSSFKAAGGDTASGVVTGDHDTGSTVIRYYGFLENTVKEEVYDPALEDRFKKIYELSAPDIVHCFGAEYPHTLAAAKAFGNPDRFVIGIQGICIECAKNYTAHLPGDIVTGRTFRDLIKRDSIGERQQKFYKRAENENAAVKLSGNVLGRTGFDNAFAFGVNPGADYYHVGENLRSVFYSGAWSPEKAEKHRIFFSQADYPLKGFHYLLKAVGELVSESVKNGSGEYSDITIFVAGQSLVSYSTLKDRIRISRYGKYLRDLAKQYGLTDRIRFLGRLSAGEMKEQYLKCDTFVCCSSCENSSNSLGEAMMLQTPIVTTLTGGLSSVFDADRDGFSYEVSPNDDFESISERLKQTLVKRWECGSKDPGMIERLRHNAGFHARENHNPARNVHDLLSAYRKIGMK